MTVKKRKGKPIKHYRLFARIIEQDGVVRFDSKGRTLIPTKWIETEEINLGSKKNPNTNIIEVRLVPNIFPNDDL